MAHEGREDAGSDRSRRSNAEKTNDQDNVFVAYASGSLDDKVATNALLGEIGPVAKTLMTLLPTRCAC